MARYEVTRGNPENENYLEGLRDEDKAKQIAEAGFVNLSGNIHEDSIKELRALKRTHDTMDNWSGITPSRREPEPLSLEERLLGPIKPTKQIPNESEFLPGMSTQEMHPIKHDDYHVSKQLVEHVNKLSTMSARRQPTDYHVETGGPSYVNTANLIHTPTGKEVGRVEWKDDGYVNNLAVDVGHRHMTNYLVTQAWNHSRTKGEAGPASSDLLSPFSEKIVRKYNRDSQGFRTFEANKAERCSGCGGDGEVRLSATPSEDGRHVRYSEPSGTVGEYVSNTPEGRERFTRTVSHLYGVTHQSGGIGALNPQTGTSHWWHDYHITCPTCAGSGERQIHE